MYLVLLLFLLYYLYLWMSQVQMLLAVHRYPPLIFWVLLFNFFMNSIFRRYAFIISDKFQFLDPLNLLLLFNFRVLTVCFDNIIIYLKNVFQNTFIGFQGRFWRMLIIVCLSAIVLKTFICAMLSNSTRQEKTAFFFSFLCIYFKIFSPQFIVRKKPLCHNSQYVPKCNICWFHVLQLGDLLCTKVWP